MRLKCSFFQCRITFCHSRVHSTTIQIHALALSTATRTEFVPFCRILSRNGTYDRANFNVVNTIQFFDHTTHTISARLPPPPSTTFPLEDTFVKMFRPNWPSSQNHQKRGVENVNVAEKRLPPLLLPPPPAPLSRQSADKFCLGSST